MGICIRCPHQCILPALSHPVSCSTVSSPNHTERELGLSMGWQHPLSCCVNFPRHLQLCSRILQCYISRFAQYVYGVYLGLNGEFHSVLSNQRTHISALPSFAIPYPLRTSPLAVVTSFYGICCLVAGVQCRKTYSVCILWTMTDIYMYCSLHYSP